MYTSKEKVSMLVAFVVMLIIGIILYCNLDVVLNGEKRQVNTRSDN